MTWAERGFVIVGVLACWFFAVAFYREALNAYELAWLVPVSALWGASFGAIHKAMSHQ